MKKIFFVILCMAQMALGASFDELSQKCTDKDQSGCKELFLALKDDCLTKEKKESCELATGLLLLSKDTKVRLLGIELVEKGCNLGSGSSCLIISNLYTYGKVVERDIDKAFKYGEMACASDAKGSKEGCAILGAVYAEHPRYKNLNKAIEYSNKACEGGVVQGCFTLGNIYIFEFKEHQKAHDNYKKACDNKYFAGCNGLGILYNNGFGVEKDTKKAFEYFDLACKNNDIPACLNQAKLYYFGDGIKKDEVKAKELAKKVCDAGIKEGCKGLALAKHNAINQNTGGLGLIEITKTKK